jgi:hypothetical protein
VIVAVVGITHIIKVFVLNVLAMNKTHQKGRQMNFKTNLMVSMLQYVLLL